MQAIAPFESFALQKDFHADYMSQTLSDESVIQHTNTLLLNAIQTKASDIHIEPQMDHYRVRYRQDGLLKQVRTYAFAFAKRLLTRLKVMANLDITEHRLPQDGRFCLPHFETHPIDCRVNICPTLCGEKMVIRILNAYASVWDLNDLGLSVQGLALFLQALQKPQGLILITGPTGSGKTTTLYAALQALNVLEKNISTVEDPVEIQLAGINQVNIHPSIGLGFAHVFRALLRQDPDIILLGEIRDKETADLAINAAHTGHLVLSTLHTTDAIQSILRLNSLGVKTVHMLQSLSLIVAQRLVRRLCPHCKIPRKDFVPGDYLKLGFSANVIDANPFYKAQACSLCFNGYQGRMGLFEFLPITPSMNEFFFDKNGSFQSISVLKNLGLLSLYEDGLHKVACGETSIEELMRVSPPPLAVLP